MHPEKLINIASHFCGNRVLTRTCRALHRRGAILGSVAWHDLDRLQQLAEAMQGKKMRLQRKKYFIDRRQRIQREHAQRWRAIENQVIETLVIDFQLVTAR